MNDDIKELLISRALAVRVWAYAPYSKYQVGASLLASSGKIYDGVNVENAAYPSTICAERAALVKAISEGERQFETLVVATENGGSPCGSCRQMLAEFGLDLTILIVNAEGKLVQETSLKELLPQAFTPASLK
ncbi:MAG: cytidine deaminase [Chloroflexi bacterium]|nr:cytidine deaminase [Chloroflexota bacterium]